MVNPTGRVELGGHELQSMDFCVLECTNLLTFFIFLFRKCYILILLLLCYDIV